MGCRGGRGAVARPAVDGDLTVLLTPAWSGWAGRGWPRSRSWPAAGCRSSGWTPAGSPPRRPGATAASCSEAARRPSRTPRRGGASNQALDLYRRTLAELAHLIEVLGPDVVRRVGSIRLGGLPGDPRSEAEAADRVRELADCEVQRSVLTRAGIAVETYDGELGQGLYLPDDGATNPAARAIGLATALSRSARLFERTTVRAISSGLVQTAGGAVSAPVIVVAVDGRLDVLLPALRPLVRTARLQMLATAPGLPARLPCRCTAGGATTMRSRTRPGESSPAAVATSSPPRSGLRRPSRPRACRAGSRRSPRAWPGRR